jgi:hypothetical protein
MRRMPFLRFGLVLFLTLPVAHTQTVNPGRPENMDVQHIPTPAELRARVNNAQFQKDAQELSELCASVPADLDGLKQGLLGKDMLDKLKRIEKLSKRVREGLTR